MLGNQERADDAWKSVQATFATQVEDGGFAGGGKPGDSPATVYSIRVENAYFFLQELGRALLVLKASPLEPAFHDRAAVLMPQVRKACDFVQGGYITILPKVGHTANRLVIAAKAFGLCGVLLDDERLTASSQKLIKLALQRRDEEGVFLERGGRDSSYNAVVILMGQHLSMYVPNPELDAAIEKAMRGSEPASSRRAKSRSKATRVPAPARSSPASAASSKSTTAKCPKRLVLRQVARRARDGPPGRADSRLGRSAAPRKVITRVPLGRISRQAVIGRCDRSRLRPNELVTTLRATSRADAYGLLFAVRRRGLGPRTTMWYRLDIAGEIGCFATNAPQVACAASSAIRHSAKFSRNGMTSRPFTATRFTGPLSAVVPRTSHSPVLPRWTCVITVVGGKSLTGSR